MKADGAAAAAAGAVDEGGVIGRKRKVGEAGEAFCEAILLPCDWE